MSNENQEIMVKFDIDGNEIKLTPSIVQEYIVGTDAKIKIKSLNYLQSFAKLEN